MPRSGFYVDNAQNRSLGRVGMAYGSHSGGGSSSSGLGLSSSSAAATASFELSYSSSRPSSSRGLSGRTYVDNPLNRILDRVGMEHGTAVHSRSGSSSGSSGRTYVDNPQNRSLGRVGMEHGTAVHSRSGSSSWLTGRTYVDNPLNRILDRVGMEHGTAVHSRSGSSSGSGSSWLTGRTYVDNPQNRSLGRVGMEHGTAVHSRSGSSSGLSGKTYYVDNPQNRSLGRVGMEHGTAVHSRSDWSGGSSGSSGKTYVDNPLNRSLGRVGMEHGTAVHSRSGGSSGSGGSGSSSKTYVDNAQNRSLGRVGMEHGTAVQSSQEKKVYKDNALNRKLGRVGLPLGSKPQRKADGNKGAIPREETPARNGDGARPRAYVDNAFNRKHNRVGLPLGSAPISRKNEIYQNNAVNRHLGRVGKPMGSCPVEKKLLSLIRKLLEDNQDIDGDIPAAIEEMYVQGDAYIQDEIEHVLQFHNREQFITERQEECEHETWDPHQRTPASVVESCRGNNIKYEDLDIKYIIGHGGFGEVYVAEWNNEVVAVKKLKNQNLTKKHHRWFANEVEIFCQLDHENITCFIGFCDEPPNFAIVMEYMDMSLFDAIHIEEVDLDSNSKVVITRNIIFGLTYLHAQDIAHCDLKTQNVLVNNVPGTRLFDESKPILAKLTDFGLSTMRASSETSTSASRGIRGTPKYAAPEVLRGERLELRKLLKADVYSLGLVIFELALEEIPFDDLNLTQLIENVGRRGLRPKPTEGLKLDIFVKEQLDKCFSFHPDKRPTAYELADAALDMTSLVVEEEE